MNIAFETERLVARPWTLEDVEAAFAMYRDPEVTRFIRDAPEESLETQRITLEKILARYHEMGPPYGFFALVEKESEIEKESGTIVGAVMLKPLPEWPEVEVGWHLARRAWGKGYATEAARACLSYGFRTLERSRLVAVVNPHNERSLAVARRLGMSEEGTIHAYSRELVLFTCERDTWQPAL